MFITFEGGEGSGKTTVIKKLKEKLISDGILCITTREPGGSPIAEAIRDVLLDKKNTDLTAQTEALLFAAARCQHLDEVIIPALKENKVILCDRYLDSSIAYQAFGRQLGLDFVTKINDYALNYMPVLTFFLRLCPVAGSERVAKNRSHKQDRLDLETTEFHQRVMSGYEYIAKMEPNRFIVIDASKTPDEILDEIYEIIKRVYEPNFKAV